MLNPTSESLHTGINTLLFYIMWLVQSDNYIKSAELLVKDFVVIGPIEVDYDSRDY